MKNEKNYIKTDRGDELESEQFTAICPQCGNEGETLDPDIDKPTFQCQHCMIYFREEMDVIEAMELTDEKNQAWWAQRCGKLGKDIDMLNDKLTNIKRAIKVGIETCNEQLEIHDNDNWLMGRLDVYQKIQEIL